MFGEKLANLRKEKGMSQEDLANELNVSRQAVSKWESNGAYPETDKIINICKLFDISMDELMGIKKGVKKENKFKPLNILNDYFDKFIASIKMFYKMTFKEKIKCLIEFSFYFLLLFILFVVLRSILLEIIRKVLYIFPSEILYVLIQIFDGIFCLVYLLFTIFVISKLYQMRYLDYYDNYIKNDTDNVITLKDEKIIIRDADNNFKLFNFIYKGFRLIAKSILFFLSIALGVLFIILIAAIIFTLFFITKSNFFFLILTCLIGIFLLVYIFIELFIKYIFNLVQNPKKLFFMFILSLLIIGISSGIIGYQLTTFDIVSNLEKTNLLLKKEIKMEDDLVIGFINYYDAEVIYEERDNILIEVYGNIYQIPGEMNTYDFYCDDKYGNTKYYKDYYYSINFSNINDIMDVVVNSINNKKIVIDDYSNVKYKVYISKRNYEILQKNEISCYY